MKYFRVGVPFVVVLACVINFITAYQGDNNLAMMGYLTAFFGWVAVAYDEYLTYRRSKGVSNVRNSVT
jgi:hypothetical protein